MHTRAPTLIELPPENINIFRPKVSRKQNQLALWDHTLPLVPKIPYANKTALTLIPESTSTHQRQRFRSLYVANPNQAQFYRNLLTVTYRKYSSLARG